MHMHHAPESPIAPRIHFQDFLAVDIRVGVILSAEPLEGARTPSLRLMIDFGPTIGLKRSCAQLAQTYTPPMLIGRRILAVVNFPPRQIGSAMSDVLTLGVPDENGHVVLVSPDRDIPLGGRLF
jgi:tRNA-binding protein